MQKLLTTFVLGLLLAAPAGLSPLRAAGQGSASACGGDAPHGLILHHAYDSAGKSLDPPLAIVDPTGAVQHAVDVPDPREITPLDYGCKALVTSANGGTYLVDGATGDAERLDLGELEADLEYDNFAGGKRYGLFAPGGISPVGTVLVDFETGAVMPLLEHEVSPLAYVFFHFSPAGNYLVITSNFLDEAADNALIPLGKPGEARLFGDTSSFFQEIDDDEELLLYRTDGPNETERLIVEEIATGSIQVVATAPKSADVDAYFHGRFLPGQNDLLAVYYVDRIAIVDLSGRAPVERYSVDGDWGSLRLAPSGTTGLLGSDVPLPVSDGVNPPRLGVATWSFVDFESGALTPLVGESGLPIRMVGPGGARWQLAEEIGEDDTPASLLRVDLETGELDPLITLEGETVVRESTRFTADGRHALLATTIEGGDQRLRLLDSRRGTVLELVTAGLVSGAISADGRWVSYSTLEMTDDGRTIKLVVVDAETGDEISRGRGLSPVWLNP